MYQIQKKAIGNRIQTLRKEKNLTLKELGNALGIRDNTLSQYETGKRSANIGVFIAIANFFGVSMDYLLCNDREIVTRKYLHDE